MIIIEKQILTLMKHRYKYVIHVSKQWQEKDKRINNDPQNMHTILKIE
jgi:hypothetical protein